MGKRKSAQGSDCHCLTIAIAIACQSFLSWLNLECCIPWSVFGDAIAIAIAIYIAIAIAINIAIAIVINIAIAIAINITIAIA